MTFDDRKIERDAYARMIDFISDDILDLTDEEIVSEFGSSAELRSLSEGALQKIEESNRERKVSSLLAKLAEFGGRSPKPPVQTVNTNLHVEKGGEDGPPDVTKRAALERAAASRRAPDKWVRVDEEETEDDTLEIPAFLRRQGGGRDNSIVLAIGVIVVTLLFAAIVLLVWYVLSRR
jgi:hypothetical protein